MLKNMKTSIKEPWGDTIDTVKHSGPLDEWYKDFKKLDYNYFRLPSEYSFDLDKMRYEIRKILDDYNPISMPRNSEGARFTRYRGLGFYAREESDSPLEDHFVRRDRNHGRMYADDRHLNDWLPELYEEDFDSPTEILNDYFKSVFSKFKTKINKASILELRSGGWLGSHVDFPYYNKIRLHASIWGSENAWYEIEGEKFQIPEDGHWYFIDTGKYHSVWNYGPQHRLTLNVNLMTGRNPKEMIELGTL
jgi:hypothetical protein